MHARLFTAAILAGGCSGDKGTASHSAETGSQLVELYDVGMACLYGGESPATGTSSGASTTFDLGVPTSARVLLDPCASGCATEIVAHCSVRVVNTEIVISATASYLVPGGDVSCDDVCLPVEATCPADPIDTGYWVLDYGGGHSDGFSVPGESPVPCAVSLRG